jgi:hypothetical protein
MRLINKLLGAAWMIGVGTGIAIKAWFDITKGAIKSLDK